MKKPISNGIVIKKKFGQHFLRESSYLYSMIDHVKIDAHTSVFEIGVGDGALTAEILATKAARLWTFEIDPEWASYVEKKFPDKRLKMHLQDILQVDFSIFQEHQPWILLANLPYQITFPIMHLLQQNKELLQEGVIMVQEEVAQKIVKKSGRGYGYSSLFFQHHFAWTMLDKVPPTAFEPAPKIYSRLLHFRPRLDVVAISQEEAFWKWIKMLFHQPRRTIKNNLAQSHYDTSMLSAELLSKRAQQLGMEDFLTLWKQMHKD